MAKRLRNTEPGTQGVRRILRQQTRQALAALHKSQPLSNDEVHEVRKQLKKVRATLRLLRKALGSRVYDRENAFFRDIARPLTEVRDAKILMDTLDQLTGYFGDQVNALGLDQIRRALQEHYQEIRQHLLEEDRVGLIQDALQTALKRVKQWPLGQHGWSVLGVGLKRIYREGRDACATARKNPSEENLHEWRKQVKYLWHQLQILQPLQPALIKALADQAHTLADYLGNDHDLAVLHQKLLAEPDRFPDYATVNALTGLIGRRQVELQAQAEAIGQRLYEEKPQEFVNRFQGYWRSWRKQV